MSDLLTPPAEAAAAPDDAATTALATTADPPTLAGEIAAHLPTLARGPASIRYLGNSLESAGLFARIMFLAKVGGESCQGPYDLFARIMFGLELGLGPMEAIRELFITDGKIGSSARLMLKLAKRGGVKILWLERTSARAACRITTPDGESDEFEFTMEDATVANLANKKNFTRYPKPMLTWRCLSQGLNLMCPELLGGGLHLADELGAETDESGTPLLSAPAPADVKKQMADFDRMINDGTPFARAAAPAKAAEPKAAPAPPPVDTSAHLATPNAGLGLAIKKAAIAGGRWISDIEEVSFTGKLAEECGLDNGSFSPAIIAAMDNATDILAKLEKHAKARADRQAARQK